jgi:transposase
MKAETISVIISFLVLILASLAMYVALQTQNSTNKYIEEAVDKKVRAVFENKEKQEKEQKTTVVHVDFI